jgi:long-chain acyl-CoA synthetase
VVNAQGDLAELCRKDQVKKEIMASLKKAGEAAHLKGFERLADIHLEPEAFSSDNGLVTPTFKLKRPQVHTSGPTGSSFLLILTR